MECLSRYNLPSSTTVVFYRILSFSPSEGYLFVFTSNLQKFDMVFDMVVVYAYLGSYVIY